MILKRFRGLAETRSFGRQDHPEGLRVKSKRAEIRSRARPAGSLEKVRGVLFVGRAAGGWTAGGCVIMAGYRSIRRIATNKSARDIGDYDRWSHEEHARSRDARHLHLPRFCVPVLALMGGIAWSGINVTRKKRSTLGQSEEPASRKSRINVTFCSRLVGFFWFTDGSCGFLPVLDHLSPLRCLTVARRIRGEQLRVKYTRSGLFV